MPKSFTHRPSSHGPYQVSAGSRWHADDFDLLLQFLEGRTTAAMVARRLGRSVDAVYRMASRMRESMAGVPSRVRDL
jgi:hypothetical protein